MGILESTGREAKSACIVVVVSVREAEFRYTYCSRKTARPVLPACLIPAPTFDPASWIVFDLRVRPYVPLQRVEDVCRSQISGRVYANMDIVPERDRQLSSGNCILKPYSIKCACASEYGSMYAVSSRGAPVLT